MSGDERAGARTGPAGSKRSGFWLPRASHYLLRGVLSGGALVCACLILTGLSSVAAPLPDRESVAPVRAVMAAPAALPDVPEPAAQAVAQPAPAPAGQPGTATGTGTVTIPIEIPAPAQPIGSPQLAFADWATRLARVTPVPQRALQAYAHAHALTAAAQPNCRLTWVTLAAIAAVESKHGGFQGRTLEADGRPSEPIIGVPLNGAPGVKAIADTDGGLLDGDNVWDHAVGPFQFIPSTWAVWRADGNGDGISDPQNIDDASVAAAKYLCADNRNLSFGDGWLRAILSYNQSVEYAQEVYGFAQGYARDAKGAI